MTSCRSCGAEIVWAVTTTGRRMPVDAEPRPDGNVQLTPWTSPPTALVLSEGSYVQPEAPRYTSHRATCPHANQHRRTR